MSHLHILAPGTGAEGARSPAATPGARHSFKPSDDPRRGGQCRKCGRIEKHTIHAYSELAHQASVEAHFQRAAKLIGEGEWALAELEGRAALRILREDG